MYFIKYNPLKEQLRERSFTDRDGLPYYILYVAASTFLLGFPLTRTDGLEVLSASINSIVVILGILYAYRKNGGISGYDFMQKSIVLGWIVFFRCFWLFFLVSVVFGYLAKKALGLTFGSSTWIDIVESALFIAFYSQRLGRHIQDTNKLLGEQENTPDAARNAAPVIL